PRAARRQPRRTSTAPPARPPPRTGRSSSRSRHRSPRADTAHRATPPSPQRKRPRRPTDSRHGCHARRMPARPAPPRVQRTFAFVDLCGFTDFADSNGDDEAADVLHLLRASLRESATNHGIRVDKWLGDGAMVVGVDTPPVLAAVVEAKWAMVGHSPLALRGGVAAGPVMVFEGDDYVGGAVNLAAKLCDL